MWFILKVVKVILVLVIFSIVAYAEPLIALSDAEIPDDGSPDSWRLNVGTIVITPSFEKGNYAIDNYSNSKPQRHTSYKEYGLGVDLLTRFGKAKAFEFGPWIGEEIGWMTVHDDTTYLYSITNLGIGFQIKIGSFMRFYITTGYGFVATTFVGNSGYYEMKEKTSSGWTSVEGVSFTPFKGWLRFIGFNAFFKTSPFFPEIKGKNDERGYELTITSFFGITFDL